MLTGNGLVYESLVDRIYKIFHDYMSILKNLVNPV